MRCPIPPGGRGRKNSSAFGIEIQRARLCNCRGRGSAERDGIRKCCALPFAIAEQKIAARNNLHVRSEWPNDMGVRIDIVDIDVLAETRCVVRRVRNVGQESPKYALRRVSI